MQGKLEVNIKITELPKEVRTIKKGWQEFFISADDQKICVRVRPRIWKKLQEANEQFPQWIASITGKMGHRIQFGFALLEPAVQVYEKKIKIPKQKSTDSDSAQEVDTDKLQSDELNTAASQEDSSEEDSAPGSSEEDSTPGSSEEDSAPAVT